MADFVVDKTVIVRILGEEYPIAAHDDAAYISRVADFVDARMKEIAEQSRTQARDKITILTAMSIASELLEKSDVLENRDEKVGSRFDLLLSRLDSALVGNPVSEN